MPRTKISEFSSTPANNTDIDSINIAEGCAPSGINDAIRELMAQLKDFQTGAVGDSFNGPVGTSTAAAGAFTTLSATGAITSTLATGSAPLVIASTTKVANLNVDLLDGADWAAPAALGSTTPAAVSATTLTTSSTVTLNGGTANGVAYLNGSKVVTSGSALTFTGSNLGVGIATALQRLHVYESTAATGAFLQTQEVGGQNAYFGVNTSGGSIQVAGANPLQFSINSTEGMRLTSTGLGIGTSSVGEKLTVAGGCVQVTGNLSSLNRPSSAIMDFFSGQTRFFSIGADSATSGGFSFRTSTTTTNTERMVIDSSGNFGLGVTPSAWASVKAIQYINGAAWGIGTTDSGLSHNAYFSGGWKYISSSAASTLYAMSSGAHAWSVAPSGTAGNAITFTQAMTLDASGNWQLGTTTAYNPNGFGRHANIRGATNAVLYVGKSDAEGNCLQLGWTATESYVGNITNTPLTFITNNTERARIDSSGNLLVNSTSGSNHQIKKAVSVGSAVLEVFGNNVGCVFYNGDGGTPNAANAPLKVWSVGATGRSINAAGTINASGADYAEYMTKSGDFTVAKGDVVGIDAQGKLTNVYADAVSFVVKSTDPSYVGNDKWGGGIEGDELEAARQTVDRIAFAGQVPVNVLGASAGQYIIPVNNNGAIKGQAVSNPTFEQYQSSVGKVIAIEADGRALIIVKVA